jgi:hypothetical protein
VGGFRCRLRLWLGIRNRLEFRLCLGLRPGLRLRLEFRNRPGLRLGIGFASSSWQWLRFGLGLLPGRRRRGGFRNHRCWELRKGRRGRRAATLRTAGGEKDPVAVTEARQLVPQARLAFTSCPQVGIILQVDGAGRPAEPGAQHPEQEERQE